VGQALPPARVSEWLTAGRLPLWASPLRIRAGTLRRRPACLKSLLNLPQVVDQLLAL
jgi:hypothetical protein